jgi:hypothetical protein
VRRVHEIRVSGAQVSRELAQCIATNEKAGRRIEDTVIGVELLDCSTTAGGVPFAEPAGFGLAVHDLLYRGGQLQASIFKPLPAALVFGALVRAQPRQTPQKKPSSAP